MNQLLRSLPKMDFLLEQPEIKDCLIHFRREFIVEELRAQLAEQFRVYVFSYPK